METFQSGPRPGSSKHVAAYAGLVVLGLILGGYAFHEHRVTRNLTAQNQQVTASLDATRAQVDSLAATVKTLATRPEPQPAPRAQTAAVHGTAGQRHHAADPRLKKMQSQLDAQGKAIEDTRTDLSSTRTELTGSIARTHDELVLLQKKGERSYYEFDIDKSKQFQHDGPVGVRLRKANSKHQYADLELLVDDRNLSQKHVNLYQPVMFYTPDSPQAVELVINRISKDHIHGYVSMPKYRQSELASMSNANQAGTGATQTFELRCTIATTAKAPGAEVEQQRPRADSRGP